MPCYLLGRITIEDVEMFKSTLQELGYEFIDGIVRKDGDLIGYLQNLQDGNIFRYDETFGLNKNLIQKYSEKKIRVIARRKGWQIESVKQEDGKVKMILSS